jgi:hypothetical protein
LQQTIIFSGRIFFKEKKFEEAQRYYVESMSIRYELGTKYECVFNLLVLAELLAASDHHVKAAGMLGSVKNYFESNKLVFPRSEQTVYDGSVSAVKEKLSDEEFSKYFEEGKLLTIERFLSEK